MKRLTGFLRRLFRVREPTHTSDMIGDGSLGDGEIGEAYLKRRAEARAEGRPLFSLFGLFGLAILSALT